MGDVNSVVSARRPAARRVAGWAAAVLAVVVLVLFVLGTWNPTDLVVLWRFAGNPFIGAMIVFALAVLSSWLLAPIGSEARQIGRARLRVVLALCLLVSVLGYLLAGPRFAVEYTVMASNDSRTVVLYNPGTDFQRLHVWTGTGLGRKYAGDLGKPCGQARVTLVGSDTVKVVTSYVDVELRLDPATGKPLDQLGPTCTG
jgi:hypothetical protein